MPTGNTTTGTSAHVTPTSGNPPTINIGQAMRNQERRALAQIAMYQAGIYLLQGHIRQACGQVQVASRHMKTLAAEVNQAGGTSNE